MVMIQAGGRVSRVGGRGTDGPSEVSGWAPSRPPGESWGAAVEGGRIGKVAIDLEASRSTSSTTVIDPSRPQTPISSRRAGRLSLERVIYIKPKMAS